jgi:hypothetical protein
MTAMVDGPLELVLEFARAESTGDPHTFRFGPQTYVVRSQRGGYGSAELLWDAELLDQLAGLRSPRCEPQLLARIGEQLRRFLAPAGWELHEQQLTAATQQHRPVHVTIRSAAAELYMLPWELLTLRATGQSLGGLPGVLVRYEWPETVTAALPAGTPDAGRILVAWSAAGGAVPAGAHINAVRTAAAAGGRPLADGDVLPHASPGRIAAALAGGEVAVLHLLCHGGMHGASHGLALDGEAAGDPSVLLDAARLQQIVAPHAGVLRLVVLAACDSGDQGGPGGLIGSAAQMLHRAGVAAVVASRYPLTVAGSERLTAALYHALLAERAPLERAFVAARTALAGDVTSLDWASVQLYARAADGFATRPLGVLAPSGAGPGGGRRRRSVLVATGGLVTAALAGVWASAGPGAATDGPSAEAVRSVAGPDAPAVVAPPEQPTVAPTKVVEPPMGGETAPGPGPGPASGKPVAPVGPGKPKAKPVVPDVECSSGVESVLSGVLKQGPGPEVRLTVEVSAGSLVVRGEARARKAAQERLDDVGPGRIAGSAKQLPCFVRYTWTLPDGS